VAGLGKLTPARIDFDADGPPQAPAFGDGYHARIGATEQARAVFLAGNGLPQRWAGRADFTVLEVGFGLGQNFLATWAAWRAAPCERLHYVAIEGHPPARGDLRRALAGSPFPDLAADLVEAWPPLVAGWHAIDFDGGRVQLLLAFGPARQVVPQLDLAADAIYLDGFAPSRNPAMWEPALLQALARRAAPGATAATWTVARGVREALQAAGFELERAPGIGGKRETLRARFAPRFQMKRPPARGGAPARAVVIGAGLAGGWAAFALRRQGWAVQVLDRRGAPAQEASGNPAGLFHGVVLADDGPHARLTRAAALLAERTLRPWVDAGQVPGALDGLLRLADAAEPRNLLQTRIDRHGLPPEFVQALDADQASRRAGIGLDRAAWWFPGGGWLDPAALVRHLLAGAEFCGGTDVQRIERVGEDWQVFDRHDAVIAEAPVLVLANADGAARLWPAAGWPIGRSRGQISLWQPAPPDAPRPRVPVAGGGYLLAGPGGTLLAGATAQPGDDDPALRSADDDFNRARLLALTGWAAPPATAGRVGWRVNSADRLPIVGPVPAAGSSAQQRMQAVAREPGLYVLTALGSRGITWGPLVGQVLAAWVSGAPMPVESPLRDALDPARWQVRAARRGR
jgi:tRNA 5-methylaminomethyl-2-thiouridine biosynthesis bifunctional protein